MWITSCNLPLGVGGFGLRIRFGVLIFGLSIGSNIINNILYKSKASFNSVIGKYLFNLPIIKTSRVESKHSYVQSKKIHPVLATRGNIHISIMVSGHFKISKCKTKEETGDGMDNMVLLVSWLTVLRICDPLDLWTCCSMMTTNWWPCLKIRLFHSSSRANSQAIACKCSNLNFLRNSLLSTNCVTLTPSHHNKVILRIILNINLVNLAQIQVILAVDAQKVTLLSKQHDPCRRQKVQLAHLLQAAPTASESQLQSSSFPETLVKALNLRALIELSFSNTFQLHFWSSLLHFVVQIKILYNVIIVILA